MRHLRICLSTTSADKLHHRKPCTVLSNNDVMKRCSDITIQLEIPLTDLPTDQHDVATVTRIRFMPLTTAPHHRSSTTTIFILPYSSSIRCISVANPTTSRPSLEHTYLRPKPSPLHTSNMKARKMSVAIVSQPADTRVSSSLLSQAAALSSHADCLHQHV